MPGELEQSRADEFLPDWIDALPTAQLGNRPFFLGSDAGLTLSLFRSEVDYVYVYSHTDAAKLTASIQLYAESSEPVIYTHSIVIKPDTLHAIPLSPILMGAMPMHTAILFEVSDSSGNILFSRTIIIRDHHQLAAQLYLTDKYGLLRSFIPRSLSRSLSFEADQVLLRFSRTQAVTRRTETLSATSFPMPKRLADAVVDSLPNKAYILIGSSLYPVRIAPSTYSAYTSDQNLTTVTFDFFVESVQQHAIPYAPPRSIQSPIPDLSLLSESGQPIGTEQYEFITAEYIHQ